MSTAPPSAPSADDLAAFEAFAARLCEAARRETLPRFRQPIVVDDKAGDEALGDRDFDPVTDADRAAETAMRALIAEAYPDHGVSGEEHETTQGESAYAWRLDPIDGTRGFISGLPLWTTLIALTLEGRPILGVIDQPYFGERFIGCDGRAWFEHGAIRRPLSVRACAELTEATVSTTDPGLFDGAETAAFDQVRRAARLARYGCDAYAYAMLAAGSIDLVIESGLKPHDVAALIPVVEGAGGILTDWRGSPQPESGQVIAAGDPRAHAEALVALKRSAR
jgi:histidinol phosphatase-like enzyme (inositol monophosphatase family)